MGFDTDLLDEAVDFASKIDFSSSIEDGRSCQCLRNRVPVPWWSPQCLVSTSSVAKKMPHY
ncbi:hypothetical protein BDZ89DRAFT_1066870 [Hymenopellis radicata]|nr:hypothetical protein BDZ89DRAFT_1066870 [Hymenopellis radicata]